MSDSDCSDSMAELHEIVRDYTSSKKTSDISPVVVRSTPDVENPETNANESRNDGHTMTQFVSEKEKYLDKIVFNEKDDLYENLALVADEVKNKAPCESKKRKHVWNDSDDEETLVGDILRDSKKPSYSHLKRDKIAKEYLTNKFTHLQAPPKWADLDQEKEVDSDEELLQTIGFKSPSITIPANTVQIKRLKDLNRATYAEGSITSVHFHPISTMGLVAGTSGVVSLYAIDGIKNEKLHNVNFQNFPIKCARIQTSGTEVVVGSYKKYFYSIDLIAAKETRVFLPNTITRLTSFEFSSCGKFMVAAGRFGEIHLMDSRSKELIHTYKQEDPCTGLQFLADSSKIFSHSNGPGVTIFDIRQLKIQHVYQDDGCIHGKTVAVSPNCEMIATGSNEGVVNIYDYKDVFLTRYPKPKKIIGNLTTSISVTKFNHSSEILGICSEMVTGACKLVHFPSATVYSNFPGQQTYIGHVTALDFSPQSGFMVLGSRDKKAPLFRLKHFKSY